MNLTQLLTTLEAPIVVRPTRRMTQGELESYLDKAADILRGNADHSEFRGYVFALLFYKRINDCFEEDVRKQAVSLKSAGIAVVVKNCTRAEYREPGARKDRRKEIC
jgi:type I restriction enzyme M protein